MSTFVSRDGAQIFYKDWGSGQPVVFSHGWPLSADAWDPQMMFLAERGHRVIAHDRRGHGRSSQTWTGNDMDTWADDLALLMESLDLHEVVLVGHSTGGGEVVRCIGRHGTVRVSKVVLLSAVPPLMLRTQGNPAGLPMEVFDELRERTLGDRSQFFQELAVPFYGYNRSHAQYSQGVVDAFWLQGMQASIKAAVDCIAQFSETDFTEDLKRLDVPTLVAHGDDDQIVPISASALRTADMVEDAVLKIYRGGPHGIATIHPDAVNADLLSFIRSGRPAMEEIDAAERPRTH
jgi:non-heme chloroperoxidase